MRHVKISIYSMNRNGNEYLRFWYIILTIQALLGFSTVCYETWSNIFLKPLKHKWFSKDVQWWIYIYFFCLKIQKQQFFSLRENNSVLGSSIWIRFKSHNVQKLLKPTAKTINTGCSLRFSPTYKPASCGSVNPFHACATSSNLHHFPNSRSHRAMQTGTQVCAMHLVYISVTAKQCWPWTIHVSQRQLALCPKRRQPCIPRGGGLQLSPE